MHTESSLGWGGQEIRILTEAEGMLGRGHEVTLVCPPQSNIYHEAQLRNIPVIGLEISRKRPSHLHSLFKWLKKHPVGVINTHSSTDSWLTALAVRLLKDRHSIVRTRHISAVVPNNAATRWLYTRATRHIVTTGEALRRQLIEMNRYPAERITSVPTGMDVDHYTPGDRCAARRKLGLTQDIFTIGIVATLRSWKGHQYLVDAFAQLKDHTTRLLIIGDGPQHAVLEKLIATHNLGARVIMAGNQRDVLPWLHVLDVFVLPSYANEGVPQALVQAMLCGLPVITTPVGAIPEAVRHEQTGLMVEPRQVAALRDAITRLQHDETLRSRLSQAASVYARARFSATAMLDNMERIFNRVAR